MAHAIGQESADLTNSAPILQKWDGGFISHSSVSVSSGFNLSQYNSLSPPIYYLADHKLYSQGLGVYK